MPSSATLIDYGTDKNHPILIEDDSDSDSDSVSVDMTFVNMSWHQMLAHAAANARTEVELLPKPNEAPENWFWDRVRAVFPLCLDVYNRYSEEDPDDPRDDYNIDAMDLPDELRLLDFSGEHLVITEAPTHMLRRTRLVEPGSEDHYRTVVVPFAACLVLRLLLRNGGQRLTAISNFSTHTMRALLMEPCPGVRELTVSDLGKLPLRRVPAAFPGLRHLIVESEHDYTFIAAGSEDFVLPQIERVTSNVDIETYSLLLRCFPNAVLDIVF